MFETGNYPAGTPSLQSLRRASRPPRLKRHLRFVGDDCALARYVNIEEGEGGEQYRRQVLAAQRHGKPLPLPHDETIWLRSVTGARRVVAELIEVPYLPPKGHSAVYDKMRVLLAEAIAETSSNGKGKKPVLSPAEARRCEEAWMFRQAGARLHKCRRCHRWYFASYGHWRRCCPRCAR